MGVDLVDQSELSAPLSVANFDSLAYWASLLEKSHTYPSKGARRIYRNEGLLYEGELRDRLIQMKSAGYLPSQVRKHCISSIFLRERNSRVSVIGLTFRNPSFDRSLVHHLNVLCDNFEEGDIQHVMDMIRLIDEIWGDGQWNRSNETYWTRKVF